MKKRKVGSKNKKSSLAVSLGSTIRKGNDPVFARKFVTWGVIISAVMVGVSLFVSLYFMINLWSPLILKSMKKR